ncbi:hypothetical protein A3F65_01350 [Candidatus Saccharibacteria bacterium RIFCSPHIGHO2_12_FULL_47_16b]|nr:MAG: hypothetical protein A3F65_01350 [Candidatus Saccharibacteria bacterium RIFCSPHIGHO2_12_FULL_47_16b]
MAKVLLVEDDKNLREIFEMRLQAEGYSTSVAGDGEEALVVALKDKPDLIILDIMMPKMSGFEVLETLRASPDMADVKVIMMTALGQAEDRMRGEKLGVIKYLVKSQVTLEDFVRTVKEVIGGSAESADKPQPSDKANEVNNKVESEKKMDDNSQPQNPAPAEPAGGGGDMPAGGMPPADDAGAGDQMSTSQAQDAVDKQVDDAMGGTAAPAGGDMGGGQTDTPVAPPPADQGGSEEQPGQEQGDQTTAPGGM